MYGRALAFFNILAGETKYLNILWGRQNILIYCGGNKISDYIVGETKYLNKLWSETKYLNILWGETKI